MCIFFENNRIPFSSFDPCNAHLDLHDRAKDFLTKHDIPAEPIKTPRFWINDRELTLTSLIELAKKNLLHSIINKRRCPSCYTLKDQMHRSKMSCELCKIEAAKMKSKQKLNQYNSTRVSPDITKHVKGLKAPNPSEVKSRKAPTSTKGRSFVSNKENVTPLYLDKKNKGSKIGKGSFLEYLEPSQYPEMYEQSLNVTKHSELPEVEEFDLEDSNFSIAVD